MLVEKDLRIDAIIGGGPHGVVYLATGTDHRSVALKVLSQELGDPTRHSALTIHPRHPRLVEVDHTGRLADGSSFLAMPFVSGMDVASLLAEAPFPPRQALRVVRQALDALRAVHDNGIAHGDLKPENLMVSGVGIVDDDLRDIDEPVHVLDLALGSVLKPQARGQGAGCPTPASDIYAMGVVLAEMLSGEPISSSVVFDARWTEELSFLIWKAVQEKPRDRYRNATEMIVGVDCALRSLDRST